MTDLENFSSQIDPENSTSDQDQQTQEREKMYTFFSDNFNELNLNSLVTPLGIPLEELSKMNKEEILNLLFRQEGGKSPWQNWLQSPAGFRQEYLTTLLALDTLHKFTLAHQFEISTYSLGEENSKELVSLLIQNFQSFPEELAPFQKTLFTICEKSHAEQLLSIAKFVAINEILKKYLNSDKTLPATEETIHKLYALIEIGEKSVTLVQPGNFELNKTYNQGGFISVKKLISGINSKNLII